MNSISPTELKTLLDNKSDCQVIDVREPYEFDEVNIGAKLIPMGEVISRSNEISKDKQVIIHCRSGKRSAACIEALERECGFSNLYNLEGGILGYLEKFPK